MGEKTYYVYIVASVSRVLYVGVTSDIEGRVLQHKQKQIDGFTKSYNCTRLAYFEEYGDVRAAITREKQIKGWLRKKKVALIETKNPGWKDLSESWWPRRK